MKSKLLSVLSKIDTAVFKITGVYLIYSGIVVIARHYSAPIPAGTMYILFGILLMIVRRTK